MTTPSITKYTIMDAPKLIQVAREHSILGYYTEALIKYKAAFTLIQQRRSEIKDEFLLEKWRLTEANINVEIAQTVQILNTCKSLRTSFIDYDKKQLEDEHVKKQAKDVIVIPHSERNSKKAPNINHFGGKMPFGQVKDNEDPFDDFKKGEINSLGNANNIINLNYNEEKEVKVIKNNNRSHNNNNISSARDVINTDRKTENVLDQMSRENNSNNNAPENFVLYKKPVSNNNLNIEKKDPMVWDPPEEKNNNKRRNLPAKKITPVPLSKRVCGGNANNGNKANMAKIYDEVDKYKGNKKKYGNLMEKEGKVNSKETPKSAFLLHHYADGVGPDSELIEMLEREVVDSNPFVNFEDIAELDKAKNILKEAVLLPILMPNFFKGIRRPWKGVLLYGPPGTGKTMLAKALATQGKTTFFNVHSSSFASKWRGESEKLIRLLFEMARFYAPTTIFIDEVDSLGSKRGDSNECEASRRVKSELLVQMDGVTSSSSSGANEEAEERKIVMVLAATNRPWDLDEALRRRFEKRVYIPLPNEKGREQLFNINLKNVRLSEDFKIETLIKMTEGYSGSDIANVCREAALMPMRKKLLHTGVDFMDFVNNPGLKQELDIPISQEEFMDALQNISKSVSEKDLKEFVVWTEEFKSL